mgnify:CR=1 FL=1
MFPTPDFPPTPVPLPTGQPHFDMGSYTLWNSTDSRFHLWNMAGELNLQAPIQLLFVIAAVLAGAFIVWKFIGQFIRRDAEE